MPFAGNRRANSFFCSSFVGELKLVKAKVTMDEILKGNLDGKLTIQAVTIPQ